MANVNGTEINLMPTEGMREEARRYRDWKADGEAGGTEVAARRASQILSGDELSPDTVITMAAWFARHEVDKQGEGFSPGEDGYPSNGRVAWAAWGGDPGQTWATAKAETIKRAQERSGMGTEARPYPNEHAARLADPDRFDELSRVKDEGGPGIDFIYGINGDDPIEIQAIRFDSARYTVAESKAWLSEHDFTPIVFEPATDSMDSRSQVQKVDLREINQQPLYRSAVVAEVARAAEDPDVVEFTFSSEQPVERYFGMEVLSHDASAMNMERLNSGAAPWLWNHNPEVVLGVVERAWMGDDRRGRVRTRWSPNTRTEGSEEYKRRQDWESGTIRNVSFMYSIDEPLDTTSRDGFAVVTRFTPMEVSAVSIPADHTVGQGRKAGHTSSNSPPDAAAAPVAPLTHNPTKTMDPSTIDMEAVRAQAAADERTRVASITSLCREHKADDLAQGLIESGASEADAMRSVLAEIAKRPAVQPATPAAPARSAQPIASGGSADIGLTEKEARSFSFVRAIRAQLMPDDRQAQEDAAFEREASVATVQHMARNGHQMQARGFVVPNDVLRRDLTAGTAATAGDLIFTDARPGSFIEALRKRNALTGVGITVLSGLTGPVSIPKQTGEAQVYWKGEGAQGTQTEPTFSQVSMTLKEMSAWARISRSLVLQSSIDVEQMVRNELAKVAGLEQARVGLYGLGSSSQPEGLKYTTGINTVDFASANPTYAELVAMETAIAADDADIGAMNYITNATLYGGFKTTEKAANTAQFVLEPGNTVNSYGVVRSNQVETGDVWFGAWSELVLGLFGAVDLQVNPYSEDREGNIRVTIHQAIDYAVRHPEAFCRGNNTL